MLWTAIAFAADGDDEAPACPEVLPHLDAADDALVEVRVDEAERELKAAEEDLLACRAIFDRQTLGRLWLLEGVLHTVHRDEIDANDAFRAAGRVAPDVWEDAYGPAVRGQYELAVARTPADGQLVFVPELGGNRAWVDGEEVSAVPVELESGLHAVQISDPTGVVLFGQVLWLPPEESMRLATGVPTAAVLDAPMPEPDVAPAPVPLPSPPAEPVKLHPLLYAGAGAVVAGAGLVALSVERSAAMDRADDFEVLRNTYRQHAATRVTGLALIGVGGAAAGLSFTF